MVHMEKKRVSRSRTRVVSARQVKNGRDRLSAMPGDGGLSPKFRVTFFRQLTNSHGKPHEVDLATVHVHDHATTEGAVAAAIKQFEQRWRLTRWQMLANRYEVEALA